MRYGYIVNGYTRGTVQSAGLDHATLSADTTGELLYSLTRLLLPATVFASWALLRDGTVADPANVLLILSVALGVLAIAGIRRYWVIRRTSRSRRDSAMLAKAVK